MNIDFNSIPIYGNPPFQQPSSRTNTSPDDRRVHHRSAHDLSAPGNAALPLTFFGRQPPSSRRSLSNHCLLGQQSPSGDAVPGDCGDRPADGKMAIAPTKRIPPHERPISFPMGVTPQRRDIPLTQPPPRYG